MRRSISVSVSASEGPFAVMGNPISQDAHPHDAFYIQYGKALASWAQVEDQLCVGFCLMLNQPPFGGFARALFFSGRSFASRADLMSAAIAHGNVEEVAKPVWKALLKKARQFSAARNAIAHGVPVSLHIDLAPYEGIKIKEGVGTWDEGGINVSQLAEAEGNFDKLNSMIHAAAFRQTPFEECLSQVESLPNAAFSPG